MSRVPLVATIALLTITVSGCARGSPIVPADAPSPTAARTALTQLLPDAELALKLARETGVTYELVMDPDGAYFDAVGGRGMPTTLFVDADGVVVHRQVGPMTAEQLRTLVDDLLAGG